MEKPIPITLVICPELPFKYKVHDPRSRENRMGEAIGLAEALGLTVMHHETIPLRTVRAATLLGSGHIERIKNAIDLYKPQGQLDLVIIDAKLSPVQQQNLEKVWKVKVIDRIALILEIFGERAQTYEGTLQVELAALSYQRSRLVRTWTHLERQRGGFGFIGGPGEKQLEMDRRLIDERTLRIKRDLEKVKRTRSLHRSARKKVPYPTVALVGYTNTGKSTLFNKLTKAAVLEKDMLFATLDPTMRRLKLNASSEIILSDTVGFISDLPTQLIAAFRATLEEVLSADLLIHVRDISHPEHEAQKEDVLKLLHDIGVDDHAPIIEALNKTDLLTPEQQDFYRNEAARCPEKVIISALYGTGLEQLLKRVDETLSSGDALYTLELSTTKGQLLAWIYDHGRVLSRKDAEETITLHFSLPPRFQSEYEGLRLSLSS